MVTVVPRTCSVSATLNLASTASAWELTSSENSATAGAASAGMGRTYRENNNTAAGSGEALADAPGDRVPVGEGVRVDVTEAGVRVADVERDTVAAELGDAVPDTLMLPDGVTAAVGESEPVGLALAVSVEVLEGDAVLVGDGCMVAVTDGVAGAVRVLLGVALSVGVPLSDADAVAVPDALTLDVPVLVLVPECDNALGVNDGVAGAEGVVVADGDTLPVADGLLDGDADAELDVEGDWDGVGVPDDVAVADTVAVVVLVTEDDGDDVAVAVAVAVAVSVEDAVTEDVAVEVVVAVAVEVEVAVSVGPGDGHTGVGSDHVPSRLLHVATTDDCGTPMQLIMIRAGRATVPSTNCTMSSPDVAGATQGAQAGKVPFHCPPPELGLHAPVENVVLFSLTHRRWHHLREGGPHDPAAHWYSAMVGRRVTASVSTTAAVALT